MLYALQCTFACLIVKRSSLLEWDWQVTVAISSAQLQRVWVSNSWPSVEDKGTFLSGVRKGPALMVICRLLCSTTLVSFYYNKWLHFLLSLDRSFTFGKSALQLSLWCTTCSLLFILWARNSRAPSANTCAPTVDRLLASSVKWATEPQIAVQSRTTGADISKHAAPAALCSPKLAASYDIRRVLDLH